MSSAEGPTTTEAAPVEVFISFRFAEAEAQAKELQQALQGQGLKTFVSNEAPGASLQEAISSALGQSRVQVMMATRTYGKKTNETFSTLQEMNYALNHTPFLIKMCDAWEEPAAELALDGRMYELWMPDMPMPSGLPDSIVAKMDGSTRSSSRSSSQQPTLPAPRLLLPVPSSDSSATNVEQRGNTRTVGWFSHGVRENVWLVNTDMFDGWMWEDNYDEQVPMPATSPEGRCTGCTSKPTLRRESMLFRFSLSRGRALCSRGRSQRRDPPPTNWASFDLLDPNRRVPPDISRKGFGFQGPFQYGEQVAVQRSTGEIVKGRLESNSRGVALRDWTAEDVCEWMGYAGLKDEPAIYDALKNRPGSVLLKAGDLLKDKLEPMDLAHLSLVLGRYFEFELHDPDAYIEGRLPPPPRVDVPELMAEKRCSWSCCLHLRWCKPCDRSPGGTRVYSELV